ncbi:glycosyltransferase [Cryobacterium sp. SO2]|uniref:glycosyltransferase n=1 Tax=Cryobacterium sp. SO2 TaxID=1897060 RepID=UPI00223D2AD5|nr:glycosyltransferase [Cryobacterium sp. SO2]WEO76774.1 glycosyltransferase [Cryobacterium sp. SO2]
MRPRENSSRSGLVSIGLFLPYDGIPHAGGEYLLRHFEALEAAFQISAYAPGLPENVAAAGKVASVEATRRAVAGTGLLSGARLKPLRDLLKLVRGASLAVDVEHALKNDPDFLQRARSASVLEFQWTETASLARFLRRVNPKAVQVLIAHDVLAQRWSRASAAAPTLKAKVLFHLRAVFARRAERRAFTETDVVIVFSDKDRDEVLAIAPSAHVEVSPPSLVAAGMPDTARARVSLPQTLLFTGALNRDENHEALVWFLGSVWPAVQGRVATAEVVIAGAAPRPELADLVEHSPRVSLTGYVDDLGPFYAESTLFVVPLLRGAGVKFKTITAMLWGIPVVSTSVGAEGVGVSSHYLAVDDTATGFAEAIVAALGDQTRRDAVARTAFDWAHGEFGAELFTARLRRIYAAGTAARSASLSAGATTTP